MNTDLDLPQLTAIALDAARAAAEHVNRAYRSRPAVERKLSDADLVTRYDLESEQLIRRILSERTPQIPIVGEEQGGVADARPTWFCDPIDGTTNFAHGHPFFAVSIGLMREGIPLAGAVVAPQLHAAWHGYVGSRGVPGAAFRNGVACTVSGQVVLADALCATGFSPVLRRTGHPEDNLAAFLRVSPLVRDIRRCGSAALDLCLVADGTYEAYWERRLAPWDCAAGAALVLAAGGHITDLTGGPVDLTRGYFLASNGHVHGALIEQLAPDGATPAAS
ncbi:MAG: inositol monophosphatase family protein [Polyangiales bacterium]